jgi:hypothetical protein
MVAANTSLKKTSPSAPNGNGRSEMDLMAVVGRSGLKQYGGFVYEEFLRELQGDRWKAAIREMTEQDPVIGAIQFVIEMLMRQVPWSVQPGLAPGETKPSPDAEFHAEFFDGALHDMSQNWEDLLAEIISFLPWGFDYHEINYKVRRGPDQDDATLRSRFDDGLIGWRSFSIRSQDSRYRWEFDDAGGVQGMWQMAPPDFTPTLIPIDKALLFRTTVHKGNPEGRSILRSAYRPWYMKKNIENIEGVGVERDLAGLPVALVPPDLLSKNAPQAKKDLRASIEEIVKNIRRDQQEGILFPREFDEQNNELYKLELLTTGGSRQFDTDKIITRYDLRIAMVVVADFIMIGQQQVGSFALVNSKTNTFTMALVSWLDMIAEVINEYAIPRLMTFNGWPINVRPKLTHGNVKDTDLVALSTFIKNLSDAGVPLLPNPDLVKYLLEEAGLPVPSEEAG